MRKVLFTMLALVLVLSLALPMAAVVGAQTTDTIYGITNTGSIHEVDPISGIGTEIDTVVDCPIGGSGPNGLAYDQDTNRIYYLEYPDQAYTGYAKDGYASLYFTDLDTGVEEFAGLLEGEIANADIYEGHYYYIAGGTALGFTDDLYELELLADGTVGTKTKYPDISFPDNHEYGFWGDIAIQDGVIYGNGDCKVSGHDYEFFRVNCDGTGFEKIAEISWGLQLAFGLDGTLYGHDFSGGKFYTITWTDTSVTRALISNSSHQYTDCASGMTATEIDVYIDIKPTSCPNPLNMKSKGVLPVAILGTEDFDVTQIDPASVRLEGVAPLRWSLEDVATPFTGEQPCNDAYACTTEGPDGYLDLTLKFDRQEIVAALGEVSDGYVLCLELTGNLKDEFGGTAFTGKDVVWIIKKGKG